MYAGMDGLYVGRSLDTAKQWMDFYEIEYQDTVFMFIQEYDKIVTDYSMEKAKEEQKKQARASRGGKQHTHNIQGNNG